LIDRLIRRLQEKKVEKLRKMDLMLEKKCFSSSSNSSSSTVTTSGISVHDEAAAARRKVEVMHVTRDVLSMRVANDGLGYENRMMFILPDCLRLKSEVSECSCMLLLNCEEPRTQTGV